jgi:hypothetical protein
MTQGLSSALQTVAVHLTGGPVGGGGGGAQENKNNGSDLRTILRFCRVRSLKMHNVSL